MSTIKEVSKHAGVSVSTVSRVVNGTKYVSPEIEKRVKSAIEELNYRPSAFARGLRMQKSQSVGIFLPAINDGFFCNFANTVEKALYEKGYHPLFCNIENDIRKESVYVDILLSQQVDAVIIVPLTPPEDSADNVQKLLNQDIPVVMVDRTIPGMDVSQVLVDNFGGGYEAGSYLLKLGHRHVGVIASEGDQHEGARGPGSLRIQGIQAAFKDAGVENSLQIQIKDSASHIELGYHAIKTLLDRAPQITAIFALTDQTAVGVYHGANELGLSIPEDISVMGFDNIPLASHIVPQLTTIAQPIALMGEIATRILLQHIAEPTIPPESITLNIELVVRASVKDIRNSF